MPYFQTRMFETLQSEWTCPITHMPIKDPVITEDGHTYEKNAIIQWFYNSSKSPKTGLILDSKKLVPNRALRSVAEKFDAFVHQFNELILRCFKGFQQIIQSQIRWKQETLLKINRFQKENQTHEVPSQFIKSVKTDVSASLLETIRNSNKIAKNNPDLTEDLHIAQKIKRLRECCEEEERLMCQIVQFQEELVSQKQMESKGQHEGDQLLNFHILQKESSIKWPETLLHPFQYLIETFKSERQIKARYQKSEFTQLSSLGKSGSNSEHQRVPLDMDRFLKYDWKSLKSINLMDSKLNDKDWSKLVSHSHRFPNLKEIKIYQNCITTVKKEDLEGFSSLKSILFYTYGGWTNPLSQESKECLKKYKESHPDVYLLFQE